MSPVDVVAKIILTLSQDPTTTGSTFHIRSRKLVPYVRIGKVLKEILGGIEEVPYTDWQLQLDSSQEQNALYQLSPFFPSDETQILASTEEVDTKNMMAILTQNKMQSVLECDTDALLHLYISYLIQMEYV